MGMPQLAVQMEQNVRNCRAGRDLVALDMDLSICNSFHLLELSAEYLERATRFGHNRHSDGESAPNLEATRENHCLKMGRAEIGCMTRPPIVKGTAGRISGL
jgi:hypothetical protein